MGGLIGSLIWGPTFLLPGLNVGGGEGLLGDDRVFICVLLFYMLGFNSEIGLYGCI